MKKKKWKSKRVKSSSKWVGGRDHLFYPLSWVFLNMGFLERLENNWGLRATNFLFSKTKFFPHPIVFIGNEFSAVVLEISLFQNKLYILNNWLKKIYTLEWWLENPAFGLWKHEIKVIFIIIGGKWWVWLASLCLMLLYYILYNNKSVHMIVTATEARTCVRSHWSYHTHCALNC